MNERIKELRKFLGLTQLEFADKLGVVRNNIAGYETAKRHPSDAVVSLICKINWSGKFVNEEWLRYEIGEMFYEVDRENLLMIWVANVLKNEDESFKKRFVSMLSQLNESDWEILEKMSLLLQNKD